MMAPVKSRHSCDGVMNIIGTILCVLGFFICLAGSIMFLKVAYQRSMPWFLGCLFVPVVWFIFFFMNVRATARPFAISIAGFLTACFGDWLRDIE